MNQKGQAIIRKIRGTMTCCAVLLLFWLVAGMCWSVKMLSVGKSSFSVARFWIVYACLILITLGCVGSYFLNRVSALAAWYEMLLDTLPHAVVAADKTGRWIFANREARKYFASSWNDGMGRPGFLGAEELSGRPHRSVRDVNGKDCYLMVDALCGVNKEEVFGHVITLLDISRITGAEKTKKEVCAELLALNERMIQASGEFVDSASMLTSCTSKQAELITEIADCLSRGYENTEGAEAMAREIQKATFSLKETALCGSGQYKKMSDALTVIFETNTSFLNAVKIFSNTDN